MRRLLRWFQHPTLLLGSALTALWGVWLVLVQVPSHAQDYVAGIFGLLFLGASAFGLWALYRARNFATDRRTLLAMIPQQTVLSFAALAQILAVISGRQSTVPGGRPIPADHLILLARGLPLILLALFHVVAILRMNRPILFGSDGGSSE